MPTIIICLNKILTSKKHLTTFWQLRYNQMLFPFQRVPYHRLSTAIATTITSRGQEGSSFERVNMHTYTSVQSKIKEIWRRGAYDCRYQRMTTVLRYKEEFLFFCLDATIFRWLCGYDRYEDGDDYKTTKETFKAFPVLYLIRCIR